MAIAAADKSGPSVRSVALRTRGHAEGPVRRLTGPWADRNAQPLTPSAAAELIKPFVFLDLFDTTGITFEGFGLHPHSGLMTVTYVLEGSTRYEDTTGATGVVPAGAIEWFKAGHGAWHGGGVGHTPVNRGFQLWVALPPDQELGEVESHYLPPEAVPKAGPVTVLLGAYGERAGALEAPSDLTYLAVRLTAGEVWSYAPPATHDVCWVALARGAASVPDRIDAGELVIFEPGPGAIDFRALSDTEFVLGSAVKHPYELALGRYSVHTSPQALAAGEDRIDAIKDGLVAAGRL